MNLLMLALTAAIAISTEALPTPSETFMHSTPLDENGNYVLYWKFDDKSITFETHVRTTGWVGFGISHNGGMTGSDVVIGWVNPEGKAFLKDRYATENKMPMVDPHQDWFLLSGREEAGFTILKFYRALDTKDCVYDRVITLDTLRVIWSFRNQDPADDNDLSYHGATNRGTKSINLLEPTPNRESADLSNAATSTFIMPAILVPSTERTVYFCQVFRMPNITRRHHIIKYSPVVQKENAGVVHHIVAYGCYNKNPDQFIGLSVPCFDGGMPMDMQMCRYPMAVWAVGGGDFYFPDNVGFGIGGPRDANILILETHYDNPEMRSDIIDSSGLQLWYTPELRQYDAGVFIFGNDVTPQQVIPPGTSQFTITGVCHSNCTAEAVPAEGVNVFGTLLHAHLIGREIRVRQFRGDKQVSDFGRDNQYDFNYQQIRLFDPPRKMMPGDTIITECIYDSTSRKAVTFGGLATTEEMCVGWLLYYPKIDLSFCSSDVDRYDQLKALNSPHLDGITSSKQLSFENFTDAISSMTWSPALTEILQMAQTHSNLSYQCFSVETGRNIAIRTSPYPLSLKFAADPQPDCSPTKTDATNNSAKLFSIKLFAISMSLMAFATALFK